MIKVPCKECPFRKENAFTMAMIFIDQIRDNVEDVDTLPRLKHVRFWNHKNELNCLSLTVPPPIDRARSMLPKMKRFALIDILLYGTHKVLPVMLNHRTRYFILLLKNINSLYKPSILPVATYTIIIA